MVDDKVTIPVACSGTKHFYSMVKILNQQVGKGQWTARGRVVRKLRRIDNANHFFYNNSHAPFTFPKQFLHIKLVVPKEFEDISTTLDLWSEHG